jgi:hypothetical protein
LPLQFKLVWFVLLASRQIDDLFKE